MRSWQTFHFADLLIKFCSPRPGKLLNEKRRSLMRWVQTHPPFSSWRTNQNPGTVKPDKELVRTGRNISLPPQSLHKDFSRVIAVRLDDLQQSSHYSPAQPEQHPIASHTGNCWNWVTSVAFVWSVSDCQALCPALPWATYLSYPILSHYLPKNMTISTLNDTKNIIGIRLLNLHPLPKPQAKLLPPSEECTKNPRTHQPKETPRKTSFFIIRLAIPGNTLNFACSW